jgi:predicted membrane protein
MIAVGLMVVFRSAKQKRAAETPGLSFDKDAGSTDTVNAMAILGACQRRASSSNFRGGEVTALMGGCEIDLRECSMSGEAVITVFAMMGGITIKVPIDWQVEMEGVPILGGFEDKTVVAKDHSKRLVVRGYAIMGGLEIRN